MKKRFSLFNGMMIALATVGIVCPQMQILASEQRPRDAMIKVVPANSVLDVSLAKSGEFSGRAVDQTGTPIKGAAIVVKSGNKNVAQVVTDKNGRFSIPNLKPGIYQVSHGPTTGTYRLWAEGVAPPSARPFGLLVLDENGARGQFGSFGRGTLILATGAVLVTVAVVAAVTVNHATNPAENDTLCVSP